LFNDGILNKIVKTTDSGNYLENLIIKQEFNVDDYKFLRYFSSI